MPKGAYKNHHYVPQWYQRRFLPTAGEQKFYYLDLRPERFTDATGQIRCKKGMQRWGTPSCFVVPDLYTTKLGAWESTEIEERFFGRVDREGKSAIEFFDRFDHQQIDHDAFHHLLNYMSVQKLRTPKGLSAVAALLGQPEKNYALIAMQHLQNLHCVIWAESVWALVDATTTETKFITSDHPVTVYNRDCFPESAACKDFRDPEVWRVGTHTLFPLSPTRLLVMTNLTWVRNPYQRPSAIRPNPAPMRPGRPFDWREVQIRRELSEVEVNQVNFIIKKRALRYIAAGAKEWLYPEQRIPSEHWRKLDDRYLLMPDPRAVVFTGEFMMSFKDRPPLRYDEYGRGPDDQAFGDKALSDKEWRTHLRFQGEFAHMFGPRRRGLSFQMDALDPEEDEDEFHRYHLNLADSRRPRRDRRERP
jgi:uncharacterized protein DUF4238